MKPIQTGAQTNLVEMPQAGSDSYVIELLPLGQVHLWDGKKPLMLGQPVAWVIEKAKNKIRVRNLSVSEKVQKNLVLEISESDVSSKFSEAKELCLPGDLKIGFKICRRRKLQPAFLSAATPRRRKSDKAKDKEVKIFSCVGQKIEDTITLQNTFVMKKNATKIFKIKKLGNGSEFQFEVESLIDGLFVKFPKGDPQNLKRNEKLEGSSLSLHLESSSWFIRDIWVPELQDGKKTVTEELEMTESQFYHRLQKRTASSIVAALMVVMLWPTPEKEEMKEKELVQYTKINLTKPKKVAKSSASKKSLGGGKSSKQAKETTAVARAFRSRALKNAVSGLLKGGMTKLLAQSNSVLGKSQLTRSSQILSASKRNRFSEAPVVGEMDAKNVQVASTGGDGVAGSGGKKGVGYGKGEKAGVAGQGTSFVALDVGGSSVEEGLSKDEVGRVIHAHMNEVRYCYESAMLRNPELEGRLLVDFTIGSIGLVKSSGVKSSSLPDPRLDDCILRRLATWKFPKPKGGVKVSVSYPFIFKSIGR